MTSFPGQAMGIFARASSEWYKLRPLVPTYLHLMGSAIFPIFIAAHASLRRPASAALAKKKTSRTDSDVDENDEDEPARPIETLSTSDAVLFPVLAGLSLTGLYFLIKWLEDPAILNKILGYYFSVVGSFFTFTFTKDILHFIRSAIFPAQFSQGERLYKYDSATGTFTVGYADGAVLKTVKTSGMFGRPIRPIRILEKLRRVVYYKVTCAAAVRKPLRPTKLTFSLTILDLFAAATSAIISLISTLNLSGTTPWYLTNVQGFSFCYGSLQYMTPGTSATGSLLLGLLFLYDIYMVFYTPMMVTVATKLEIPIKLLFPKPEPDSAKERAMAMLGLGDIVVPGIMIAFALRFDLYRHYLALGKQKSSKEKEIADGKEKKDDRPIYATARGMWAERFYTARKLWSPVLEAKDFPKPYFKATVAGYTAGMVATLLVMQVYQHAQPALLYLVPGVLSSFWGTALGKGEVKLLWSYDESEEENAEEKREEEAKKTAEKEKPKSNGGQEKTKGENDEEKEQVKVETTSSAKGPRSVFSFNVYLPPAVGEVTKAEAAASSEMDSTD